MEGIENGKGNDYIQLLSFYCFRSTKDKYNKRKINKINDKPINKF